MTEDQQQEQQQQGDGADDQQQQDAPKTFTQEEVNAFLAREKRRYKDYDTLTESAALVDQLQAASQTDTERATTEGLRKGREEALTATVPRLVRAEFRAAAKGVLKPDQLTALLEDLDLMKYANDDGEVDEDRIAKKVAAFAPADDGEGRAAFPDLGGGKRGGTAKTQNMNDLIRRAAGYSG
jgi:hypothetical protein